MRVPRSEAALPILIRPVREQIEHDRIIRVLQARLRKDFVVEANLGDERRVPVRVGEQMLYPDLVLTASATSKKVLTIIEVETTESVNHLEAMAEWAHYGRARAPFHLYVPSGLVDIARRLIEAHGVTVAQLWSYSPMGDQVHFWLVSGNGDGTIVTSVTDSISAAEPVRPAAPEPAAQPAEARPSAETAPSKGEKPAARPKAAKPSPAAAAAAKPAAGTPPAKPSVSAKGAKTPTAAPASSPAAAKPAPTKPAPAKPAPAKPAPVAKAAAKKATAKPVRKPDAKPASKAAPAKPAARKAAPKPAAKKASKPAPARKAAKAARPKSRPAPARPVKKAAKGKRR